MKLDEYLKQVTKVIHYYRTEGQFSDAIGESIGTDRGQIEAVYDQAITEIQQALKNNRVLLGIFGPDGKVTEPIEELKAKEISTPDLRRHVLKVRHDLIKYKPDRGENLQTLKKQIQSVEGIMSQILTALTQALKVENLGDVFSRDEADAYSQEFEPKKKEAPAISPTRLVNVIVSAKKMTEAEYQALIAQLKANGKVK